MTPADFIRPTGELNPDWFESDLDATLQAAITEAAGELPEAQRAFVYWRAYAALVADVMIAPSSQKVGSIAAARSDEQLRFWREQAEAWRARYDNARATVRAAVGVAL